METTTRRKLSSALPIVCAFALSLIAVAAAAEDCTWVGPVTSSSGAAWAMPENWHCSGAAQWPGQIAGTNATIAVANGSPGLLVQVVSPLANTIDTLNVACGPAADSTCTVEIPSGSALAANTINLSSVAGTSNTVKVGGADVYGWLKVDALNISAGSSAIFDGGRLSGVVIRPRVPVVTNHGTMISRNAVWSTWIGEGTSDGLFECGAEIRSGSSNFGCRFVFESYAFNPGTTFTGTGCMTIMNAEGTLVANTRVDPACVDMLGGRLSGPGTFAPKNYFHWASGILGAPGDTGRVELSSSTTTMVSGGPWPTPALDTRQLVNDGAMTFLQPLALRNGASISNSAAATIDAQSGSFGSETDTSGSVINAGTFKRSTTGAFSSLVPFTSSGTVQLLSGTTSFTQFTQTAGSTAIAGNVSVSPGTMTFNGGSLTGSGTITGNVLNAARIEVGAPIGILNISGNYTQTGTLALDVNGSTPGVQHDQLKISGSASFGGALEVGGIWSSATRSSVTVITFASRGTTDFASKTITIPWFYPAYENTALVLRAPGGSTRGDFDNDGVPDLLWRNKLTGENRLWLMDRGFLTPHVRQVVALPANDVSWVVGGVADFDRDGDQDILWRNTVTGVNMLWLMNNTSYAATASFQSAPNLSWKIGAVTDLNADGWPDVVLRNYDTGGNVVWYMNGATITSTFWLKPVPDLNWELSGAGDTDTDGNADLLWRNNATGENVIWFMKGNVFDSSTYLPLIADPLWKLQAVVRFDTIAGTDLVWRHFGDGSVVSQLLGGGESGPTVPVRGATEADLNWEIVAPR